jgi:hypothetical protein
MFIYKHILSQHGMCVCIIFPHLLKIYRVDKNGITVVLYLLVIIKNILNKICYLWNKCYYLQHFKIL